MEDFKKKLTRKYGLIIAFYCFATVMYFALNHFTTTVNDFAEGLVCGMYIGIMVVSIFNFMKIHTALHNEEKLKEMYIRETDERNIAIGKETMKTAGLVSLMVTALAVIITGFFNPVISMTLGVSVMAEAVITVAVQSYYNKKM